MTPGTILICAALAMSDADSGRCHTVAGENIRIRLQGVDAGEASPFTRCRQSPAVWACSPVARATGGEATRRARALTTNGARCTVVNQDRYRRIVARCTVNGRDLGSILVREGLAISETSFGDPYRSEERAARQERRGVWE